MRTYHTHAVQTQHSSWLKLDLWWAGCGWKRMTSEDSMGEALCNDIIPAACTEWTGINCPMCLSNYITLNLLAAGNITFRGHAVPIVKWFILIVPQSRDNWLTPVESCWHFLITVRTRLHRVFGKGLRDDIAARILIDALWFPSTVYILRHPLLSLLHTHTFTNPNTVFSAWCIDTCTV